MLRFLIKFLLLTIVLVAGTMLFAQWKLEKQIDTFANAISPFAQFDYQTAKVGLSGEVKLNAVSLNILPLGAKVEIGEMQIYLGNLYELAFMESDLRQYKLPENAHIVVRDVLIPFNPKLISTLSTKGKPSSLDFIETAFCGEVDKFSLKEVEAMGYEYLFFSGKEFFLLDKYSGSAVINGVAQFEEMFDIEYQVNIGGVLSWLESFEERQFARMPADVEQPSLAFLDLRVKDKGFNLKKAQYCSIKQQTTVDEYYTGHLKTAEGLLNEAGISIKDIAKKAYSDFIQPDSEIHWFIKPQASFDYQGIQYYSFDELADLSGLRVTVDNQPVNEFFEGWSAENFQKIAVNVQTKRIKADPTQSKYQLVAIPKEFQSISPSRAEDFLHYDVRVLRNDGQSYAGKLTKTSPTSLWVTVRSANGELVIPLARNQVVEFEVYKELKVK